MPTPDHSFREEISVNSQENLRCHNIRPPPRLIQRLPPARGQSPPHSNLFSGSRRSQQSPKSPSSSAQLPTRTQTPQPLQPCQNTASYNPPPPTPQPTPPTSPTPPTAHPTRPHSPPPTGPTPRPPRPRRPRRRPSPLTAIPRSAAPGPARGSLSDGRSRGEEVPLGVFDVAEELLGLSQVVLQPRQVPVVVTEGAAQLSDQPPGPTPPRRGSFALHLLRVRSAIPSPPRGTLRPRQAAACPPLPEGTTLPAAAGPPPPPLPPPPPSRLPYPHRRRRFPPPGQRLSETALRARRNLYRSAAGQTGRRAADAARGACREL